MPNWTSNTIRVEGNEADIRAFLEAVKWQDNIFDFNRIIPMPELLRYTETGGRKFDGKKVTSWFVENPTAEWKDRVERPFTDIEEAALKYLGYNSWYDWSIQNWGTKWNTCNAVINKGASDQGYVEICFETAWSPPAPIIDKIFELFPNLSFTFTWQNEGEHEHHSIARDAVDDDQAA